jgi:hypothetical protein
MGNGHEKRIGYIFEKTKHEILEGISVFVEAPTVNDF